MPTQKQVLRLLDVGLDYEAAGQRLGVPAGQAYLIATGLPADGGDAQTTAERERPGVLSTSSQHLVNPHAENPTSKQPVHRWLKERAARDEQMRRAAAQRDVLPAEVQGREEIRSATTVLTREHNRITAMVKQLEAIPGHKKGGSAAQISRRQSIVDLIAVALAGHELIEQEHLWPAVRRKLKDGKHLAQQGLQQEQEGTQALAALARAEPDSEEFDTLVEQLVAQLRKHVAFEDLVFARMRDEMGHKAWEKLGKKVRRAQRAAPTRPHPHAPQHPPSAVKAAGVVAAGTDRLRDAASERPADRRGTARNPDGG